MKKTTAKKKKNDYKVKKRYFKQGKEAKYCQSCGRKLSDIEYNFCLNCLDEQYG